MKLTSLLAAGLLAAFTQGAQANDYTPAVISMAGGPGFWTVPFGTAHTDGLAFTDTYTFSYSGLPGTASGFFLNVTSSGGDLNFSSAKLNGTELGPYNAGSFSGLMTFSTPVSGLVTLIIKGTNTGSASYVGTLDITSAVPEPATYGMLLGGLAMLGMVARRRRE